MTTGQRIGELAHLKKINLHKLSEAANISYNTLYSIVRRKSDKVDLDTVRKIALALDVHPLEILGDSSLELIDYGLDLMKRGLDVASQAIDSGNSIFKTEDGFVGNIEYASQSSVEERNRTQDLLAAFKQLNINGQKIAIARVGELAEIPKYQRTKEENPPEE